MTGDLTIKGYNYKLQYSDASGSKRNAEPGLVASARNEMLIQHQDYIDSVSKVPGVRHIIRMSATKTRTLDGKPIPAYINVTVGHPSDGTFTNSEMYQLLNGVIQVLSTTAADAGALNLASNIIATKEQ